MTSALFDEFRSVLTAAAGNAHLTSVGDLPTLVATIGAAGTMWVSPDVPVDLQQSMGDMGLQVRTDPSPESTRDQPWGVSYARAAIAETGSVILHENRLDQRSVSLMTESLIVFCPLDRLLPSLDEAASVLRDIGSDGSSYATFVSGPSRTADIERQLTLGVQGPSTLHVVFLRNE